MPSKKRGGLSKREVAAQKATTQAKKNASVRATASKSVAPLVGAGPLQTNQVRVGSVVQGAGPLLPNQTRDDSYSGGGSSSKSSSKKLTAPKATTSLAPTVENANRATAAGSGTISQGKAPSAISRAMASLGEMWGNYGTGRAPDAAFYTSQQRQANLNAGLGIEGAQASGPSALGLALAKGSLPDSPTGSGANGETYYNGFDPATDGAMMFQSDFSPKGTNFSRPGSEEAYLQGTNPIAYGAQRGAQQVAYGSSPTSRTSSQTSRTPRSVAGGDYTAPQASFQPVSEPRVMAYSPELDFTPVSQGQPGTNRRFLGNGYLSNGVASNGKLDSEFSGASFGMPTDGMDGLFDQDLINQILGVKTAQASEMPMASTDMSFSPQTSFSPYASNQGETAQSVANRYQSMFGNPVGQNEQTNNARIQNPGGSQGGGVAQQFAQGTTGGDPMDNYYNSQLKTQNKGFSAQEKAQKKALNELLKSITNQYKTQQSTGIDQLAKSKQEDLLKLSGLFQFANQDPDSEQRIQYEQRADQDYAGQQGDFLAKLAAAQAQEESRARQGYQTQMSDIAGQRNDARSKIEELIFNARESAKDRAAKGSGSGNAGSETFIGIVNGKQMWRNTKTGGISYYDAERPHTPTLAEQIAELGQGGRVGQQGGSWETDPETGQRVWVTD